MTRLSCCVPFCRRTCKRPTDASENAEWICGKHWRLVSKHLRRRDTKLIRRYTKKFGRNDFWQYKAGSPERIEAVRVARLCEKSWARCKKQAIERAAGI